MYAKHSDTADSWLAYLSINFEMVKHVAWLCPKKLECKNPQVSYIYVYG